jgi:hypothetical protein
MRTCDQCGEPMRAGYCIDAGAEYYCSDECLCQNYTIGQYESMYDNGEGESYWTEWDDEPTTNAPNTQET